MEIDRKIRRQIRLIATQTYIHEVKKRSGEKTFGKLQKRLLKKPTQSNEEYWEGNSRAFYKYASGKKPITKKAWINAINVEWPGTKSLLNHPLWFILENPFADVDTIDTQLRRLSFGIQVQLFRKDKKTQSYIRKKWSSTRPLDYISMHDDLDALACLLLLTREFELKERWHTYTLAKSTVNALLLRLTYFRPLRVIADKLYILIYQLFIGNNPLPDLQQQVFFSGEYIPPRFMKSVYATHDHISGILWNAEFHGLVETDQQSQLRFLFWVFTFGFKEAHESLYPGQTTPEGQSFIDKLMSAYRSTSPIKYLPHGYLID